MNQDVSQQVKFATVEAVVVRADGRREPLGIIAEYRGGPFEKMRRLMSALLKRVAPWA